MGFILNLIPLIFTDDTDLKDKFLPRIRADQMKVQLHAIASTLLAQRVTEPILRGLTRAARRFLTATMFGPSEQQAVVLALWNPTLCKRGKGWGTLGIVS